MTLTTEVYDNYVAYIGTRAEVMGVIGGLNYPVSSIISIYYNGSDITGICRGKGK